MKETFTVQICNLFNILCYRQEDFRVHQSVYIHGPILVLSCFYYSSLKPTNLITRFPYDGTKVLRVVVEEQIFFQCGPSVDMGIASVFLVDQDGFSNCSAAPRYRYDPTNGLTSKYFDSGLFAKHMFYCMGSGNSLSPSIDFTFHGEAQGRSFYLIGSLLPMYLHVCVVSKICWFRCV